MAKKIELTQEQIDYIITSYQNYIPVPEIVKAIGHNKKVVYRTLEENNIPFHGEKRVLPLEKHQEIIQKYLSGATQQELADYYGINRWSIKYILNEHDIHLRDRGESIRQYQVNEHFFDEIDTPDKAFLIGLLWSDGCNKTDRGAISLGLQDQDKYILEEISTLMESDYPIYFRERQQEHHHDMYYFEIISQNLSKRLEELGMVRNKSLVLKFSEWLNKELYPAFLLGLVDGDGSLSKTGHGVSIVGTKYLLERIQEILTEKGIYSCIYGYNPNGITKSLHISRKKDACNFLSWIYNSGSSLFLKRKYQIYLDKFLPFITNNSLSA